MGRQLKILTVDDEAAICEVFNELVTNVYGHQSYTARTAVAALDLLVDHEFDVIILDYIMMNPDGPPIQFGDWAIHNEFELACLIKRMHPRSKLFLMTGMGHDAVERAVIEADIDGYIYKPVDVYQMESVLERCSK